MKVFPEKYKIECHSILFNWNICNASLFGNILFFMAETSLICALLERRISLKSFLWKLVSLFLATILSDFRKAVLRPLTSWIVAVQLKIHFPFSQTYLYKNKHIQAFWKQNFQLSPLFLVVLSRMGWNAAIDSLVTNREKRDYFCFCPCFI